MAGNDLNLVQVIGRLGKDPEIRYMADGTAVANMTVAAGWKTRNASGTEWIRMSAFGNLAEIIEKYMHKGDRGYFAGSLRTRKWQDKQGNDRYTTEVVLRDMQMLDSRGSDTRQTDAPAQQRSNAPADGDGFDDDIPF